jgi:hypothetical protein
MCQCKAKISFTIKGNVAHLRMHLSHTGHEPNTPADLSRLPLRQEVRGELVELTKVTRSYKAIRRALKKWADKQLKCDLGLPQRMILKYVDRRFNPTSEDIHNALQHRARESRLSEIDQEDTLKQLCTQEDLAWSFRPHAGGHASIMYIPKQGLYAVGTQSDMRMAVRPLRNEWDAEVYQEGLTEFLQSRVASAKEAVGTALLHHHNMKNDQTTQLATNHLKTLTERFVSKVPQMVFVCI